MKIETLRKLFQHRPRVKLFVTTDRFCLCCQATMPEAVKGGISVHVEAAVRLTFDGMQVISDGPGGVLVLTGDERCTRRMQTHRKHLRQVAVPEQYFVRAGAL